MKLTVVCVKWGTEFGPEYVNILYDSVRRNLKRMTEGRFLCFTDNPAGLSHGIETQPLPSGLQGWWNKLYLFAPGLFQADERVLFFDLDTLITGSLDNIAGYDGPFAGLSDFYRPAELASGVMAWPGGWGAHIWEAFEAFNRPNRPGGDGAFIDLMCPEAKRLQTIFQDQFVSYKADCQNNAPPRGTRVVCFHGFPRPHQVETDWVKGIWKIGGWSAGEIETFCNTKDDQLTNNIKSAIALGLENVKETPAHDGHAVIIGGGPSLINDLDELRYRRDQGQDFFALNNAASWLAEHGLNSKYQVIMDARPQNINFVKDHDADCMLLASQVHPDVFAGVNGTPTKLWHCDSVNRDLVPDEILIGGGTTVLTRAMGLAYAMGYRKLHLYGVDSSYEVAHHAYEQKQNDGDAAVTAIVGNNRYKAATWMIAQCNEFQSVAAQLSEQGCIITVHGSGLLPAVAREMAQQQGVQ